MKRRQVIVLIGFIIISIAVLKRFPVCKVWPRRFPTISENSSESDILNYIRYVHLTPPASINVSYHLNDTTSRNTEPLHQGLLNLLQEYNLSVGFFVEAGALDGEYLSHTLDLERDKGWTGLLVEASPSWVTQLKSKNRKAWIADVCLTDQIYAKMEFLKLANQTKNWTRGTGKLNPVQSGVVPKYFDKTMYTSQGYVDCFPLGSILESIKVTRVDLLVLDVEGMEFKILRSFPFNKISVRVVVVEHWLIPERSNAIYALMNAKGFKLVHATKQDYIFVDDRIKLF